MPETRTTRLKRPALTLRLVLLTGLLFSAPAIADSGAPAAAATWVSLAPALLAILLALVIRQVIPALFAGVWLGAWAIEGFSALGLFTSLLDSFQVHVLQATADADHVAIILFSLMISGTIGIITRNGGMQGVVNRIVRWADSARHATLATTAMGLAIFFDDYTNTLVVGNSMRPVTDSMRVSRAKLAYIVDSTAAPVACIALVTTWVGYQVGLIGEAVSHLDGLEAEPYLLFLASIPYSYYPLLAIAFVFMVAASGRDFGPMRRAEAEAARDGIKENEDKESTLLADCVAEGPIEGRPQRAFNAVIPIAVLLLTVVAGLYVTGSRALDGQAENLRDVIGSADSYTALLWASMLAMCTAAALTLAQRILRLEEIVAAWYHGVRSLVFAMIILVLAWSLGGISHTLQTADFLVTLLGGHLPAFLVPALVFLLAAATSFATGSSWGAMGILTPLVVPLAWAVMQANQATDPGQMHILYASIAAVLAGSVWGDHCSPISDTTILSSMASGCDHIEHVRTQLPYALLVGAVALVVCALPVALGLPWWLALLASVLLLYAVLRLLGRKVGP
jgi:Na+/H+ antiporter NhaC